MTKVQILEEGIDISTFKHVGLPSDTHLITFTKDGKKTVDAVRAYTLADIFDEYYDKLGRDNPIHTIQSGYGTIRPNLYGKIKIGADDES